MANYFYVKSGGTAAGASVDSADGIYSAQKTGSWASAFSGVGEYFDNIEAAFSGTVLPDHGDFVFVSDVHSHTYAAGVDLVDYDPATNSLNPITLMVVDDGDVEVYSPATSVLEQSGGSGDFSIIGVNGDNLNLAVYGAWFLTGDDLFPVRGSPSTAVFRDTVLECNGTSDRACQTPRDSDFYNCRFIANGNVNVTALESIQDCRFFDCSLETSEVALNNGAVRNLSSPVEFYGCDFSAMPNTSLMDLSNAQAPLLAKFINCTFPSAGFSGGFISNSQSIGGGFGLLITGSGSDASVEYQYYYQLNENYIEDETSIYRDATTAFPSGTKISLKLVTSSECSAARPFLVDLPSRFCELSSASSDVLTFYFISSDAALTDQDVRISVSYSDGTNREDQNFAVSAVQEPLEAGTALTTNSESWTGRTTETRYEIVVDTSGNPGADSVPNIRLFVAKPSVTMFVCPTIELS